MKSSSILLSCGIAVVAWVVMILCLSAYWDSEKQPSSTTNHEASYEVIIEVDDSSLRPIPTRLTEDKSSGRNWLSLVIAVVTMGVLYLVAYRLWDDWLTAVTCVFFGPFVLIYGPLGGGTLDLGRSALSQAEQDGLDLKPDWSAILLQCFFGIFLGTLLGFGFAASTLAEYLGIVSTPKYCFISGLAFTVGGLLMIHGDKILSPGRVMPTQGIDHSRVSLFICSSVFFLGICLLVIGLLLPHFR